MPSGFRARGQESHVIASSLHQERNAASALCAIQGLAVCSLASPSHNLIPIVDVLQPRLASAVGVSHSRLPTKTADRESGRMYHWHARASMLYISDAARCAPGLCSVPLLYPNSNFPVTLPHFKSRMTACGKVEAGMGIHGWKLVFGTPQTFLWESKDGAGDAHPRAPYRRSECGRNSENNDLVLSPIVYSSPVMKSMNMNHRLSTRNELSTK
jgi:hypothetical protein